MRTTLFALLVLVSGASAQPSAGGPVSGLSHADLGKLSEALRGAPARALKVRLQAALILGRSGGAAAVSPLADCLGDDPEATVRAACALALGNTADLHAVEPLVAGLDDVDLLVRTQARSALLGVTRPEAVPYLQAARERGSPRVRQVLVELAAQIRDPAAGALLTDLLGDPDDQVRVLASALLQTLDAATVTVLLFRALDHPNYRVKAQAAAVMGERREQAAVDRLIALATSPLEAVEVQLAARAALKAMRPIYDVAALGAQARAKDGELRDRQRALVLLSAAGGPDAMQTCVELLPEEAVRVAAAQALAEIGDPRALPALREAAQGSDPRTARLLQIAIRRLEQGNSE